MELEKTFVMLKPDTVQRGLVGEILTRFEKAGLKIVALKFLHVDRDFSKKHYSEHTDKDFYVGLEDFLVSGPVVSIVLEGAEVIKNVRKMVGATEPSASQPGTIRGDYAHITYQRADATGGKMPNLIHASDSVESAKKEISLWFSEQEMFENYETSISKFI